MPDCYKIKLRSTGFHLVYRVQTDALVLLTIAIGKRDKSVVYDVAKLRMARHNLMGAGDITPVLPCRANLSPKPNLSKPGTSTLTLWQTYPRATNFFC